MEYLFKTDEIDIDINTRTIIAKREFTETKIMVEEFTIEQRENKITSIEQQVLDLQKQKSEIETSLNEVKIALGIE